MSLVGRKMQNRKFGFYLLCTVIAALGMIIATSVAAAQVADGPWMNPKLSPEERADITLTCFESARLQSGRETAPRSDEAPCPIHAILSVAWVGRSIQTPAALKGHDFSRAEKANKMRRASQAAEKLIRAIGRGFIPGKWMKGRERDAT